MTNQLRCAPPIDSAELAQQNRRVLEIRYELAQSLGRSAMEAIDNRKYMADAGMVDWSAEIRAAEKGKVSIRPDDRLPEQDQGASGHDAKVTSVVIANQTMLSAARELVQEGQRPLALNFANGVEPGGGFLRGATAQEETLCRSSALYATLFGDPMYDYHRDNDPAASGVCTRGLRDRGLVG